MKIRKHVFRITGIFLCIAILLITFFSADWLIYTGRPHIQLEFSDASPANRGSLQPGEIRPLSFSVENRNYAPIHIREILVLSLFNKNGIPIPFDGTGFSQSSYDLYEINQLTHKEGQPFIPIGSPLPRKVIQENQAIYASEYPLSASKYPYPLPFSTEDSPTHDMAHTSEYTLLMDYYAEEQYQNCILKLDIVIEGKQDTEDDWEFLDSHTEIFESEASDDVLTQLYSIPVRRPLLTGTTSFHWEVTEDTAYLTGIGNVAEADIVLPNRVRLSPSFDTFLEDPVNGTEYPVVITGSAFSGCETIRTVTFPDNATIQNDQMHLDDVGMFEDCIHLTAVYNIPDSVTSMKETFQNCTDLELIPNIPVSISLMDSCFSGCVSLTGTAAIPASIIHSYDYSALNTIYDQCSQLDSIEVDYCPDVMKPTVFSDTIPVHFVAEHAASGLCPVCHFGSIDTDIDGMNVVIDRAPEEIYNWFLDFVDNNVPDPFKATCAKLILTDDLAKYNNQYGAEIWDGFSTWPEGLAYIKILDYIGVELEDALFEMEYTIIHELSHCYDQNYSTTPHYSSSDKWIALHQKEGSAASKWYDRSAYNRLSEKDQRKETFAIATALYFTDPAKLERNCPEMFLYLQDLYQNF